MIILKKLAIHELKKTPNIPGAQIRLSQSLMTINAQSTALVESLLNSYRGDRILYAVFDESPGNYFPEQFGVYRLSPRALADFLTFSVNATNNLLPFITSSNLSKGGYFVYAEYEEDEGEFTAIFLIRDTEGKVLKHTKTAYSIDSVEYLDTNNLAMACRINEARIDGQEPNYLSFTMNKQKEVSDYFTKWICIQQTETNTEFTKKLYEIINQIEPPHDVATGLELPIEDFRARVYNFAADHPSKTINLHALGYYLYNDAAKIVVFAENRRIPIDTEFRYDPKILKRFIRLEVNADGISLKFSRGDMDRKVRFSLENPNMVIIESQRFTDALKREIQNT